MLTTETERLLIAATEQGVPIDSAAMYAGVGRSTFQRWMTNGRRVEDLLADAESRGETYDPDPVTEQPYLQLWQKVEKARAKAVTSAVVALQRGAAGGVITKEVTRKFRDTVTGEVVEETTVDRTAPDWRAAAWMLERGPAKGQFVKAPTAVEHSGADGGPIEIAAVDATALASRVQANMQAALAAATAAAITAGTDDPEVHDAELVEDQ